jgi:hypothetical protein
LEKCSLRSDYTLPTALPIPVEQGLTLLVPALTALFTGSTPSPLSHTQVSEHTGCFCLLCCMSAIRLSCPKGSSYLSSLTSLPYLHTRSPNTQAGPRAFSIRPLPSNDRLHNRCAHSCIAFSLHHSLLPFVDSQQLYLYTSFSSSFHNLSTNCGRAVHSAVSAALLVFPFQ